jgi:hypothetical protein
MYDPWIDTEETPPLDKPALFFMGTNHDVFLDYKFPENSIVIDPWRYIVNNENIKVIHVGNSQT